MRRRDFVTGAGAIGLATARGNATTKKAADWWCIVGELAIYHDTTLYQTENCSNADLGQYLAKHDLDVGECRRPKAPSCYRLPASAVIPLVVARGIKAKRGAPKKINGDVLDRRRVNVQMYNRIATIELCIVDSKRNGVSRIVGIGYEIQRSALYPFALNRNIRFSGNRYEVQVGDMTYYFPAVTY